jgi:hypothetical protein
MDQWLSHDMLLWISIGSGIALLVGAVTVPLLIVKMPQDVFSNPDWQRWLDRKPAAVRIPLRIVKNLLGVVLIVLGIAMLLLPGQGILSILLGGLLVDFPGKMRAQQWLLNQPKVMNSLNWLRKKFHAPVFKKPSSKMAA